MAKVSAEKLLEMIRGSGLVETSHLEDTLSQWQGPENVDLLTDPDKLADRLIEANLITRWQADKLLEGKHKGFFLGKYKLLTHLGSGGMSSVYLAEHTLMQRRVALKVLPSNRVDDSSYLARFRLEAQAAAALDHRNIVRVYDIDNEGKNHFIVMEYVQGRDLQALVKETGPLEYEMAAEYIRQAAEGLAHAHEAGLIHRDIKPANLLVDTRGVVKILDMGLARLLNDSRASLTIAHDEKMLGTADYLPPEQAVNSHTVDQRADIYSLGCTLYYLLTGHPPFNEGTLAERIMKHQTKPAPSILLDRPDAPKELVELCLKMMSKTPSRRFQTAGDTAPALSGWLASRGKKVSTGSSVLQKTANQGSPTRGLPPPVRRPNGPVPPPRPERYPPPRDNPLSTSDTVSGIDTIKDPPSRRPADLPGDSNVRNEPRTPGESGKGSSIKKGLPVARPLDEPPTNEFVLDLGLPRPGKSQSASQFPTFGSAGYQAVKRKRSSQPWWLWAVVGLGVVTVLALLVLLKMK